MNTSVSFVFLLAIGLSAQKMEFEIEFDNMVKTSKQLNSATLLNCSGNIEEIKEPACTCEPFIKCMNSRGCACIAAGLRKLNLCSKPQMFTCKILRRLLGLNETMRWETPMSPQLFLNYIREILEKATAKTLG